MTPQPPAPPGRQVQPPELDILRELRDRSRADGGVFWSGDDELAVFDPDAALKINAANYADLTLPDKLIDLLLRRKSEPVSWKQVRSAWAAQLRRLADADGVGQLEARLTGLLDERLGRPLDLVWLAQELSTRAFLPAVVADLPNGDMERIVRDQNRRIAGLLAPEAGQPFWKATRTVLMQIGAGRAVRRELRRRAAGRRPRRLDLADPIVDMLPELGLGRAVAAIAGVLVAIAGPPGAAAACLLFELSRQTEWSARLAAELAPIPEAELHAHLADAPGRIAPLTHRFVKETLRLWSPPLLLTRRVRTDIELEPGSAEPDCLKTDQSYLLSPHLMQRDPRHWKDPEAFDPDRWLPDSGRGPCPASSYAPFGFAPRACIGAGLGTTQLMLLCRLFSTRYRLDVPNPEAVRMSLGLAAVPLDFQGTVTSR